ncbi:MAG: maltose alpha-D-glucosyltransferase [Alphaproteobacteria bacterium]|nr:maltose alpha-D-glucosyltransferase [Alphaproteobacteria bacterium]
MIDRDDLHWYRDAIIYQLHAKSYFDANNDGSGDFAGLTQKLDYIKDLGATAIWVMPFYPSPMRDDGYDIASYHGINPTYGRMRDFKRFLREAHERGLRIITELVINHTSDQHPWFTRARKAKPGSAARNFYVWADSDRGYKDAPVIFLDTEKSNWTFDDQAKAFYWHRFFSHQPDLNFDNPRVIKALLDVMAYWLDMGVDGLRLDAVPFLIEREGTDCENLPETHAVIKKLRAAIDARYPDRMLLAEANLWPEEAAQYFGQGDECHMAFHFPLMPRIYMALAQEDRHPITDIMRQTPEVPDGAQWAIFLRNHDEMTLAMVTSSERDYLWSFFATDPRARLHLGIRRRLAPLLENDRRKIELLNSLLFSMPGTPVIYYGDEIGMGDNIYLGDRDGVRTPMQWSPDRNGGFSRADPAKLFLPAIQDPVYGFSAVNVEAQLASPSSLLTWMRRLIAVRRSHLSFGRGSLRFLYPSNRKVLAYLREWDHERILCVANVSRAPQAVEPDLSEFNGAIPVELTAGSLFPAVQARHYLLTLPAYGFYWFRLEPAEAAKDRPTPQTSPGLFTLVATGKLETILMGRERVAFEKTVAPHFLPRRRWFHHKTAPIANVRIRDFAVLRNGGSSRFILPLLDVERSDGTSETYFAPLAAEPEHKDGPEIADAIAKLRRGALTGLLYEAGVCESFVSSIVAALRRSEKLECVQDGRIVFSPTPSLGAELMIEESDVHRIGRGTHNSSLVLANQMLLKVRHEVVEGDDPEVEIHRFLTETVQFPHIPPLLGTIEHIDEHQNRSLLGTLQTFIRSQGDAWTWTLNGLRRMIETAALTVGQEDHSGLDAFAIYLPHMRRLGCRTAEMHKALATPSRDPHFGIEEMTIEDVQAAAEGARSRIPGAFKRLQAVSSASQEQTAAQRLLAQRQYCCDLIDSLVQQPKGAIKTRIHGDYSLERLLMVKDDVMIVGFGEKTQSSARGGRRKASPLADVATMLCSLAHAVAVARTDLARLVPDVTLAAARLREELILFSQVFIDAYRENLENSPIWVADERTRKSLLVLFLFDELFHAIETATEGPLEWIDTAADAILVILDHLAGAA